MKVFIILVSYNSKRFLDACIGSLLKQDYGDVQIVIVDNASPDDSNAYIEEHFPEVTLLKEPVNHGFGKACNIGARYALDHEADYVLFLNTDTESDANLVTELAGHADPATVTTCFTYNDKTSLRPWYAGGRLNRQTLDSEQTLYPYNPSQGPVEVEFISGCCMMVHKDVFAKAGFFDESYFMYYEDAEWCARLRQHGVRLLYIQSTKLFHHEAGSQPDIDLVSRHSIYYCARNRLWLASQHPELLEANPASFFKEILKHFPVISPSKNWFQYEKKGIADFLASRSGRLEPLAVEPGYGFWERETDGSNEFIHCIRSRSFLQLHNYSYEGTSIRLTFKINPPPTRSECKLAISIDGKNPEEYTASCIFDKIIRLKDQDMVLLEFNCKDNPSSVDGDNREFYFTISALYHVAALP